MSHLVNDVHDGSKEEINIYFETFLLLLSFLLKFEVFFHVCPKTTFRL